MCVCVCVCVCPTDTWLFLRFVSVRCGGVVSCCVGEGVQYLLDLEEQVRQKKAREDARKRKEAEEDARLARDAGQYDYFRCVVKVTIGDVSVSGSASVSVTPMCSLGTCPTTPVVVSCACVFLALCGMQRNATQRNATQRGKEETWRRWRTHS